MHRFKPLLKAICQCFLLFFLGGISAQVYAVTTCDQTSECAYQAISDTEYIRCSGSTSCRGATSIQSTNSYIVCSGSNACYDAAYIYTGSHIYCDGYSSCRLAGNLVANSSAYCTGMYGCYDNNLIQANTNIYCQGYYGCAYADLIRISDDIGSIYCDGVYACRNSLIDLSTTNERLYCRGEYGCYSANVTLSILEGQTAYLYCEGSSSCRYMTIDATIKGATLNIICYEQNCDNLVVNVADGRDVTVNLYSDNTGSTVTFTQINNNSQLAGSTPVTLEFGYYDFDGDGKPDMQFGCTSDFLDCTLAENGGYTIDDDADADGVLDHLELCHDTSGAGGSTVGILGDGSTLPGGDYDSDGCDDTAEDGDDDGDGVQDVVDQDPLNGANTTELDMPLDGTYQGLNLEKQQSGSE